MVSHILEHNTLEQPRERVKLVEKVGVVPYKSTRGTSLSLHCFCILSSRKTSLFHRQNEGKNLVCYYVNQFSEVNFSEKHKNFHLAYLWYSFIMVHPLGAL